MKIHKRANRSSIEYVSPKLLATAIGVSESSLKRWTDEGRLEAERTAGGHRRIAVGEAVRFVRNAGLRVIRPELLGLARASGTSHAQDDRETATERLLAALESDGAAEARSLIVSLYMEGASPGWICDVPIRQALERIGELWEHGAGGIFLEHRATETCLQALGELRLILPAPPGDAPVALGGGSEGEVYVLPSLMAATVVAEAGFEVRNLGADTPTVALLEAIRHYEPQLVWISYSVPPRNPREAVTGLARLADALNGGSLVVGGRGSDGLPLPWSPAVHRIETMSELAAFARGLSAPGGRG
ncbi:MAG: DNA-binding protein [Gemmatimonadetes bacterium]|nr:DNA-binding protein [Gemmatimonadota bacterium]